MALANYTLSSVGPAAPIIAATSPGPLRIGLDDLLYSPADQQPDAPAAPHQFEPFSPPTSNQRRSKLRKRAGAAYLPPPNQFTHYPRHDEVPHNPYATSQLHTQVYQQNSRLDIQVNNQRVQEEIPQSFNTGQYIHDPSGDYDYEQRRADQNTRPAPNYRQRPGYLENPYSPATPAPEEPSSSRRFDSNVNQNVHNTYFSTATTPAPQRPPSESNLNTLRQPGPSPPAQARDRPPGYTKVESGGPGGKTQLHAVLDYDEDYYDDIPGPGVAQPAVTPLQGPILVKNGTVPVVPLTSYPTVNNGSFYQIPILWTALSLALGYELQGQVIRGVPCVKRNYQLYCPTAGNTYPSDKIETFIDENKALIKRMYGSFETPGGNRVRRAPGVPDINSGDSYFRHVRQANGNRNTRLPDPQTVNSTGRVDACESKTEIMTPYWALNSARKLRAIVNTMHFEQAIHQEVCSKKSTSRCSGDCGCEQKYKWHRLLAYDPNDDCAGIFMDWFLFPSCCVCRCKP